MHANVSALDPYPSHKPLSEIYLTPKMYDVGSEINMRQSSDDTEATA
jgi:hypothetical protein